MVYGSQWVYINQTSTGCLDVGPSIWPAGKGAAICLADARIPLSWIHSEMMMGFSLSVLRSASCGNLLSSNNSKVLS